MRSDVRTKVLGPVLLVVEELPILCDRVVGVADLMLRFSRLRSEVGIGGASLRNGEVAARGTQGRRRFGERKAAWQCCQQVALPLRLGISLTYHAARSKVVLSLSMHIHQQHTTSNRSSKMVIWNVGQKSWHVVLVLVHALRTLT